MEFATAAPLARGKARQAAKHARYVLLALAVLLLWRPAAAQDLSGLERARGVLEASGGACVLLELWLANTPARQRRGLMYVRSMAGNQGMLFVYDGERPISMWMKNTYLPLDMFFIRVNGTVARIAADTRPLSLDSIPSGEPVDRVLELNAGAAVRWGVKPGDRLLAP